VKGAGGAAITHFEGDRALSFSYLEKWKKSSSCNYQTKHSREYRRFAPMAPTASTKLDQLTLIEGK
jgi:hypothetical protein